MKETFPDGTVSYTYNAQNKLVKGELSDGQSSTYTYNALGARIENEQIRANENAGYQNAELTDGSHGVDYLDFLKDGRADWQRAWESEIGTTHQTDFETVTRHYVVDYLSVANRDLVVTEDGSYVTRYVYDENSTRISAEFDYADGTARGEAGENLQSDFAAERDKVWYRWSLLGSTLFAVDADGEVVAHAIYDAWGAPLTETYPDTNLSGLENLNNFTGYTYDETLGLYFAQNRFYDATTHRFTQEDPIKDGGNWYVYCYDNPTGYVDQNGEFGLLAATAIAAGVAGIVSGAVSAFQSYKSTGKVNWKEAGKAAVGGVVAAAAVGVAVATGGTTLGVGVLAAEAISGGVTAFRGGNAAAVTNSMAKTGTMTAVAGNVIPALPAAAKTVVGTAGVVGSTAKGVKDVKTASVVLKNPKATAQQKVNAVSNVALDAVALAGSAALVAESAPTAIAQAKQTFTQAKSEFEQVCCPLKGQVEAAKAAATTKADFYVTPEGSAIPQSMYHSLSDVDARKWYLDQEEKISDLIDYSQSLEQQAHQSFSLRNQFRTTARELMADRSKAEALYTSEPNLTWNQIVQKQIDKGLSGDDIYRAIIESSQRSRKSVNHSLGLE